MGDGDQSFLAPRRHRKRRDIKRAFSLRERSVRRLGSSDAADDAQNRGFFRPHERE